MSVRGNPSNLSCGKAVFWFACRPLACPPQARVPARVDDRSPYGQMLPIAVPSPGKPSRWGFPGASSIVCVLQGIVLPGLNGCHVEIMGWQLHVERERLITKPGGIFGKVR